MPHPAVTAKTQPQKPAVIMGTSGEIVTYQQLDNRSNKGAQLFRTLGLGAGDHIALMMDNTREFLEIVWAAQRAGLFFTPVSTHLTKDETVYILNNCGARVFIGSITVADIAEQVLCEPSAINHFFMLGGARAGFHSWEDAMAAQPSTPISDESNGVPMLYSSGTTGQPKGILVPPQEDDVNTPPALVPFLADVLGFDTTTVYLSPAPLFHAGPLHYSMMAIYQGGTIVIMEQFDAERALKLIERHRVTHSQWVPIMFVRMLKLPAALRLSYDTSSMELAIHAAAPCPIDIKQQMIDWWGETFIEYYAATEGIGLTMIDSSDWLTHAGSVGKAVVGEIHILDDKSHELPSGTIGLVYFSGEQIRFSYHHEPGETARAYNDCGWATAGDIGYVDEEGFLYLSGRQEWTIVSAGQNIYPQELEDALVNHDKVADAAVFGVPHAELGESVQAVVQPISWLHAKEETAEEILQWLHEHFSHIKLPHSLEFHPKLPRMENGKLYKRLLFEDHLHR